MQYMRYNNKNNCPTQILTFTSDAIMQVKRDIKTRGPWAKLFTGKSSTKKEIIKILLKSLKNVELKFVNFNIRSLILISLINELIRCYPLSLPCVYKLM